MASPKTLVDKDRQKYYDMMESLFGHPGWQALMEDAAKLEAMANSLDSITDATPLEYRRGERNNLRWLLSQKAVHDRCFEMELEQESMASPEDEDAARGLGLFE